MKIRNLLLALLVMALWGSFFPMIKLGYSAFHIASNDIPSIILFAGLRFLVSGGAVTCYLALKKKKEVLPARNELLPIALGALFTIILHYSFNYIGLAIGEGSKTAIIKQISYLFLTCFSFTFDRSEKFSPYKIVAGLLGFAGIIVTGIDGTAVSFKMGDFLVLLASVCSAAGAVVSKKSVATISPVKFVALSQLFGGTFLVALGLILGGRIAYCDIKSILVFGYLSLASIVSYLLWNMLLKSGSISKLSLIKFTEPLFAVVLSGIILSENIWRVTYLAALLLMALAIAVEHIPWSSHRKNGYESVTK